jgi:hypothetical protein
MALGLNDFDGGKSIIRALEGVAPENLDFFGLKMALASLVAISGP